MPNTVSSTDNVLSTDSTTGEALYVHSLQLL